jgi:RNA polymerase sigma-70 factor (ECF subfamily)
MSELDLIQQALEGEVEAWGEIVKRYKKAVFGIAMGILGNCADAEDATQDAFIKAFENLGSYDIKRRFSTWIFTITTNICKNKLRRRRASPFSLSLENPSHLWGGSDPSSEVAKEERHSALREALGELSFKYRAPIILRYYADMNYKEIGSVLNVPQGTVKVRLHRGKALLKEKLEERGVKYEA